MGKGFDDYLAETRAKITEISTDDLAAPGDGRVVVDVRERDEFEQGVIPGAHLVPRGLLEMKIEALVPDRSTPIAIYCAAGVRSVFAAASLRSMGYRDVVSVAGGFSAWARSGHKVEVRRSLTKEQMARYSRHLLLPEVGEAGQLRLIDARVLCIGAGGLGSPAALYLAAAGVGTLGIIDGDTVDLSNLQRQILHTEDRVGMPKVDSAEQTIKALNSAVNVRKYSQRLDSGNVLAIFRDYDVVVDGCDNFATRYLVNDACVMLGLPCVHGSIFRFDGQATVFDPRSGPCYRCLYPEPPPPEMAPSCQEAGVLGVLPGIIGVLEALEAIKLILGIGEPLIGRLLAVDTLRMEFRELRLRKDPRCPMCGENPTITELLDYEQFCSSSAH